MRKLTIAEAVQENPLVSARLKNYNGRARARKLHIIVKQKKVFAQSIAASINEATASLHSKLHSSRQDLSGRPSWILFESVEEFVQARIRLGTPSESMRGYGNGILLWGGVEDKAQRGVSGSSSHPAYIIK